MVQKQAGIALPRTEAEEEAPTYSRLHAHLNTQAHTHIELTPNPCPPRPPGGRRAPRRQGRPRRGPRCRWSRCRRRAGTGGRARIPCGWNMQFVVVLAIRVVLGGGGIGKCTPHAGDLGGVDRSGWAGKRREEAGTLWRRGTVWRATAAVHDVSKHRVLQEGRGS